MQEKQMKSNQLNGIYNAPAKPGNQKEALQMLNNMMQKRVGNRK